MMPRAFLTALLSLVAAACSAQTPAPAKPAAPAPAPTTPAAAAATPTPTPVPFKVAAPQITFSQCHVDGPFIAMTFDDGPSAENTPRLLDMLKKRGIKATFFILGECVAANPDLAKRIVAEGHEIANHSWSHPSLNKLGEDGITSQLQRTHDIIEQATGVSMTLMRPPYGALTANQRGWVNKKWGYKIIMWDVDPLDWKVRNAGHVEAEILKHTVPGSIVLSHDIHKTTVDAMPATFDALAAKGFKFVTVTELLAMNKPAGPKPKATPAAEPAAAPKTGTPITEPAATTTSPSPAKPQG